MKADNIQEFNFMVISPLDEIINKGRGVYGIKYYFCYRKGSPTY